jgi:hypothetical protein
LPDVDVVPSEHFNTVLWTGTGSAQSIPNVSTTPTSINFQPDLVWTKARNQTYDHNIFDSVRGVLNKISSNSNSAESSMTNSVTAFNTDGFSIGDTAQVNLNNGTFVAWNWKANGSGSSNTDGSITSTVSANVDAGFSIVQWDSVSSGAQTIGHGLSKAPEFIITKITDDGDHWNVGATELGWGGRLLLNNTDAFNSSYSVGWNNTAPTSSVFSVGTKWNGTNVDNISYCFHSVDGYSKCGSYIGNGNADGPFVYTGFRPAFIMAKKTDAAENWVMINNKTHPYNDVNTPRLYPNLSNSEYEDGSIYVDYVSNGFKIRATQNMMNNNGSNYIYIAFAETPFKYSNAR